jgi:DNA polymerase-3 subunit epsilon
MWQLWLRRLHRRARVAGSPLQRCWQQPLPSTGSDWRQVSFLVCDAEMSSLDPSDGELLSLGWVAVDDGGIALDSARHHLIQAQGSVGQSATIHQLRDCELIEGVSLEAVMMHFLEAALGRVLVFHNAFLDMAFLNRASRQLYRAPLLLPTVDTLALEERLLRRREQAIQAGDLRLQACRDRYGLPAYPAHNALVDALATAELLLAHARHRAGARSLPLGRLL